MAASSTGSIVSQPRGPGAPRECQANGPFCSGHKGQFSTRFMLHRRNLARRTWRLVILPRGHFRLAIQDLKRAVSPWPSSGTNFRMPRPSWPPAPRCASSICCCPISAACCAASAWTLPTSPAVYERGMFLPGSMFALDVLGGTVQATGLGFDEGDADRPCLPVPGTLFTSPWLGPSVAQLQVQMLDHDGGAVLRRPAARARRPCSTAMRRAAGSRSSPIELEFYFVDRRAHGRRPRAAAALALHGPAGNTHADQLDGGPRFGFRHPDGDRGDLRGPGRPDRRRARGIRPEPVGSEPAPRRGCAASPATRRSASSASSRAWRIRNGLEATFMAKPYADMAGSGMHMHVSVLDGDGSEYLRLRRCARQRSAEAGRRRPARDDGRRHGDLRAEREQLPAPEARGLRADERDLGLQQPRRRGARAGLRRRRPPPRAPRRRRRRESLPGRGRGARRHAARHRAQARAARGRWSAMPTRSASRAAPAWRLADGARTLRRECVHAAITSASASCGCTSSRGAARCRISTRA